MCLSLYLIFPQGYRIDKITATRDYREAAKKQTVFTLQT